MAPGLCPSCGGSVLRDDASYARIERGRLVVDCVSCGEPLAFAGELQWSRVREHGP